LQNKRPEKGRKGNPPSVDKGYLPLCERDFLGNRMIKAIGGSGLGPANCFAIFSQQDVRFAFSSMTSGSTYIAGAYLQ